MIAPEKRLTRDRVKAAYAKIGLDPIRGLSTEHWNGYAHGLMTGCCGAAAVYLADADDLDDAKETLDATIDKMLSTAGLTHLLKLPEKYVEGFIAGFDTLPDDGPGDETDPDFLAGFEDGQAAASSVF